MKKPHRFTSPLISPQDISPAALKVISRLQRFGYLAYLVGGGVRDLLLGVRPKDFDVATSARPEEIAALFRNSRIIGRRFRLAHISYGDEIIETATFRALPSEQEEGDDLLILDDNEFGTPATDADRRDFTINALFYDPQRDEVIDYVDGAEDLARRLLRTIGDPVTRFREDPVRMLRAVKFAARLDLEIEPSAAAAIRAERLQLSRAALPRLYEELSRMVRSGRAARSLGLLTEYGLLDLLLPEVAAPLGRPIEAPARPLEALLRALDARPSPPPDGVIFAALFWPLLEALLEGRSARWQAQHLTAIIGSIVGPAAMRFHMPRAHMEAILAILDGQLYLTRRAAAESKKARASQKSKRGKKSNRFGHHPYFHQIYDLLSLRREAGASISEEDAATWATIAATAPPPQAPPPPSPRVRQRGGAQRTDRKSVV